TPRARANLLQIITLTPVTPLQLGSKLLPLLSPDRESSRLPRPADACLAPASIPGRPPGWARRSQSTNKCRLRCRLRARRRIHLILLRQIDTAPALSGT